MNIKYMDERHFMKELKLSNHSSIYTFRHRIVRIGDELELRNSNNIFQAEQAFIKHIGKDNIDNILWDVKCVENEITYVFFLGEYKAVEVYEFKFAYKPEGGKK